MAISKSFSGLKVLSLYKAHSQRLSPTECPKAPEENPPNGGAVQRKDRLAADRIGAVDLDGKTRLNARAALGLWTAA